MNEVLARALALQRDAALEGFDWPEVSGVYDKLLEELEELKVAGSRAEQIEEFGDLLFVMVNLARHLDIDLKDALARANAKFASRWAYILARSSSLPTETSARLEAMERLWRDAKRIEKTTT